MVSKNIAPFLIFSCNFVAVSVSLSIIFRSIFSFPHVWNPNLRPNTQNWVTFRLPFPKTRRARSGHLPGVVHRRRRVTYNNHWQTTYAQKGCSMEQACQKIFNAHMKHASVLKCDSVSSQSVGSNSFLSQTYLCQKLSGRYSFVGGASVRSQHLNLNFQSLLVSSKWNKKKLR